MDCKLVVQVVNTGKIISTNIYLDDYKVEEKGSYMLPKSLALDKAVKSSRFLCKPCKGLDPPSCFGTCINRGCYQFFLQTNVQGLFGDGHDVSYCESVDACFLYISLIKMGRSLTDSYMCT